MSFALRIQKILCAFALTLLIAVSSASAYAAQKGTSSVQTYNTSSTSSIDAVLPDGVVWNTPLKAGDMVLSRHTARRRMPIRRSLDPRLSAYPAGSLRAPLVPRTKTASPALVVGAKNSTAGVMLLQGMKSALQQSGENPDIPQSGIGGGKTINAMSPISILPQGQKEQKAVDSISIESKATTQAGVFSIDALVAEQEQAQGSVVPNNVVQSNITAISSPVDTNVENNKSGLSYEPGQEPKNLAVISGAKTDIMSVVAPPQAILFNDSQSAVLAFEEEASIFGVPVSEGALTSDIGASKNCVPRITRWTRSCQEAGYPASFGGQVVGESRRECPSNKMRDVWLSNSCANGAANPPPTQASPIAAPTISDSDLVIPVADHGVTVDALCGSSNGLAASYRPTSNLCMAGHASSVSGNGPWRWNCRGLNGGVTVSCAAPSIARVTGQTRIDGIQPTASIIPKIKDGRCGKSHNLGTNSRPQGGLCASGTASRVNGHGPWRWACSGSEGGQAMACLAPKIIKGTCGSSSREGVDSIPDHNLCEAGYASAVTGKGPWQWTCSGLHGGEASTCEAVLSVNAVCGSASMTGHKTEPSANLCSVGKAVNVAGKGPWQWTCYGKYKGASVLCNAPVLENGKCGEAHGSQFMETPKDALCETGKASRVTGGGPWDWTCIGKHDGASESCTAARGKPMALQSSVICGEPAEIIVLSKPDEKLCAAGQASDVQGSGPWTWNCSDKKGKSVSCSTLSKTEGICGAADNRKTPYAPERELCKAGSPSSVKEDPKETLWHWKCRGFMGGATVQCVAPMSGDIKQKIVDKRETGLCGAANGQGFTEIPVNDLCDVGKASNVRGPGPWSWVCRGKAGASAVCEAEKFVDASCGKVNGSIQKNKPKVGMCITGKSTSVRGNGPWLWSCVGTGGGSSVSCSASSEAQTRVDGTCGVAASSVMTTAPKVNLCDTGSFSKVYGEGPWTWTCSGKNGGVASTCQTSRIMPKAPAPPGPRVNGLCGYANGRTAMSTPHEGLCTSGTVSAISGSGPWNWSCLGENAGMTVSCTAPLTPPTPIVGVCGKASGVSTLVGPRNGLCSSGISSAVSGKGPWTWSCSGTNGGGAVSCVAPHAGVTSRGVPSLVSQALYPSKAFSTKLVTPQLPKGELPAIKPEILPNLKMSKKMSMQRNNIKIPRSKINFEKAQAPRVAPRLPSDNKPLARSKIIMPAVDDPALDGVNDPVMDSQGKVVPTSRLSLRHDVSMISFGYGSDQLDKSAVRRLEKLARILKAYKTARITMVAYSSVDGKITPRAARRLSLQRALAARDFLASKGVSTNRIDMRPMGGNVPSGDMDRIDIRVN